MWQCERNDHGCKARLHTDSVTDEFIDQRNAHTHDSNAALVEVRRSVSQLNRRAKETNEGI